MDVVDNRSCTALHFAAGIGHEQVVIILLESQCFQAVNAVSTDGNTALHFAAGNGHEQVVIIY